jgi:hypothetical protein
MAELDLAAIAARHHRTDAPGAIDHGYCQCEDGLDCRVPELLAEVARLRAFVRAWCPDDWHGGARYRQEAAALGIVLA